MGTNNVPNKNTALALNQKVAAGVDKYFAKVKSLTLGGTTYTTSSLKAVLKAETDAATAVDATKAQYSEEVATHREAKAKAIALRKLLRDYILSTQGSAALQMIGDFGMSVPKRGYKSAQVKADAAARAQDTRAGRRTKGANAPSPNGGSGQPANESSQGATTDTSSQTAPSNAAQSAPKQ